MTLIDKLFTTTNLHLPWEHAIELKSGDIWCSGYQLIDYTLVNVELVHLSCNRVGMIVSEKHDFAEWALDY